MRFPNKKLEGIDQLKEMAEIHKRVFERSLAERDYESARKFVEQYINALELIEELNTKKHVIKNNQ